MQVRQLLHGTSLATISTVYAPCEHSRAPAMHGMLQFPCSPARTLQGRHIRVRRACRCATQLEFPRKVEARGVHSRGGSALFSRVLLDAVAQNRGEAVR